MPEGGDRKKLIEVALPLEAINAESAREKSIRHGHPSTIHPWWARRPLAVCRAVVFSQLVDDPGSVPEEFPQEDAQDRERQRLFRIIEQLVKWENSGNEDVLHLARMEIARSVARQKGIPVKKELSVAECLAFLREHATPLLDPFCGGGSIPLEAQRLGLKTFASDLNPIAVVISKALVEIPARFSGSPPVNPEARRQQKVRPGGWKGAQGLANDVRYYGEWIRHEAERRVGYLYPKAKLGPGVGDGEATVIAWLWSRTVICPNPACGATMPLVRSFTLSAKVGKTAWVEPVYESKGKNLAFRVRTGAGQVVNGTVDRRGARCAACRTPVPFDHIRAEGQAGRMSSRLMAIVAASEGGRLYLDPDPTHVTVAENVRPTWRPDAALPNNPRDFKTPNYGMSSFAELFTHRQLVTLATFSDLVKEAVDAAFRDAIAAGLSRDQKGIEEGGVGARGYAEAIGTYLALAVSKLAMFHNSLSRWRPGEGKSAPAFGRQAIPMVWDYAEVNPFAGAGGDFSGVVDGAVRVLCSLPAFPPGSVKQLDATASIDGPGGPMVTTDPPYYDNIAYAELSDFFYLWLRRHASSIYPQICSTVLTPKDQELVATPYRFGGDRESAREFFEKGLAAAFRQMRDTQARDLPLVVFYAFKQTESSESDDEDEEGLATETSTGWETMLESVIRAGFMITGTWPSRTEGPTRMMAMGTNALASSIVIVCRPRPDSAAMATRQQFVRDLKGELPRALRNLQRGSIAPADLQQAAIGPGMAVFSRYARIMEAGGGLMTVRTGLQIINQVRDEILNEQETELDRDTRWCVSWFRQHGMNEGAFGEAEVLSRAMDTAVNGLVESGVIKAEKGKVRLLGRSELSRDYDPRQDRRPTVWEATQHLISALDAGGEEAAADLARKLGSIGELAKDLAYILFEICNRNNWAQEAFPYNSLVAVWPEISRMVAGSGLDRYQAGA